MYTARLMAAGSVECEAGVSARRESTGTARVYLEDHRGNFDERRLVCIVATLFWGLVWRGACYLVEDCVQQDERGAPERHVWGRARKRRLGWAEARG